jgi:hypothetical protein
MSQADAVRFLQANDLPANVIHQHLREVFGSMVMAYSTIMPTVRQTSWTIPKAGDDIPKDRPPHSFLDNSIQDILTRELGAAVQEIAQELRISASTVFYLLTNRMTYSYRKCHFMPHGLTERHEQNRFQQSCALLDILQIAKKLLWRFILTKDES